MAPRRNRSLGDPNSHWTRSGNEARHPDLTQDARANLNAYLIHRDVYFPPSLDYVPSAFPSALSVDNTVSFIEWPFCLPQTGHFKNHESRLMGMRRG